MRKYRAKVRHAKPCVFCETAMKPGDLVQEWTWQNPDWVQGSRQFGKMGGVCRAHSTCYDLADVHGCIDEELTTFAERDRALVEDQAPPFTFLTITAAETLRTARAGVNPWIVAICGSTRFIECIAALQWHFEKAGTITFAPLYLPPVVAPGPHAAERDGVKAAIDELFKRKIDLADEVIVFDLDGYVGESTRSELEYAQKIGRPVRWLSKEPALRKAVDAELTGGRTS
jgi:hypothetical protein